MSGTAEKRDGGDTQGFFTTEVFPINVCRKPRDELTHKKTQYYLPGSDNLSVVTIGMLLKQLDGKKRHPCLSDSAEQCAYT